MTWGIGRVTNGVSVTLNLVTETPRTPAAYETKARRQFPAASGPWPPSYTPEARAVARPKKPPTPSEVTQRRYIRLRLEAQRIELMARRAAGASWEQLITWFERTEQTGVTPDEMHQAVAKWEGNANASL